MQSQQPTFSSVLGNLDRGNVETELTKKLTEVITAVRLTEKPGAITLKLSIKPAEKGGAEIVFVTDQIVSKVPEFDRPSTLFFVDDESRLHRADPRQQEMEFTKE